VLAAGLFGKGPLNPQLESRLGDYIAIPDKGAYLWWKQGGNPLLGRHGGLSPEEMLIPLMIWSL
jgi:hypothetical protein